MKIEVLEVHLRRPEDRRLLLHLKLVTPKALRVRTLRGKLDLTPSRQMKLNPSKYLKIILKIY